MNKTELAAIVADKADISKEKANEVVTAITDEITAALAREDSVSLIGFGSFVRRSRAARKGKNPQTGEEIDIKASNSVGFKAGKALKASVNQKQLIRNSQLEIVNCNELIDLLVTFNNNIKSDERFIADFFYMLSVFYKCLSLSFYYSIATQMINPINEAC